MKEKWVPPTPAEIRATRKKLKLTLQKVADLLKITRNTWWRYEYGLTEISYSTWTLFLLVTGQKTLVHAGGDLYSTEDVS